MVVGSLMMALCTAASVKRRGKKELVSKTESERKAESGAG